MAQLSSAQQESHSTTESDPLGPSQGEGTVVTPGAEEGAYGTTERGLMRLSALPVLTTAPLQKCAR